MKVSIRIRIRVRVRVKAIKSPVARALVRSLSSSVFVICIFGVVA